MDYEKIINLLTKEEQKLHDVHFVDDWEQIAAKFVDLQNAYCAAMNNPMEVIYYNTAENLKKLLSKNPLDAFMTGRIVAERYYCTDTWLSLDGYCNPVTAANTTLIDTFITLEDITKWLENLDTYEQEKLLCDFIM